MDSLCKGKGIFAITVNTDRIRRDRNRLAVSGRHGLAFDHLQHLSDGNIGFPDQRIQLAARRKTTI